MSERRDTPLDEAARWLGLARDDLLSAATILAHQNRALRIVGFLSQQAAEKALKAVLAAHDLRVRKTHDLLALAASLPVRPDGIDDHELQRLTPWAEIGRYGFGTEVTVDMAKQLTGVAGRVFAAAEELVKQVTTGSPPSDAADCPAADASDSV
jgi:HEPN domain-containing protein